MFQTLISIYVNVGSFFSISTRYRSL